MCRNNDHGGRRCPHDTSEARQARRLAVKERAARINTRLRNASNEPTTVPDYTDVLGLRAYAKNLRTQLHTVPDASLNQYERDEIDAQYEEQLTRFGKVLAMRTEALVGFRHAEVQAELDTLQTEMYKGRQEIVDAAWQEFKRANAAVENLQERAAADQGLPPWQIRNWDRAAYEREVPHLLTETDRQDLDQRTAASNRWDEIEKANEVIDAKYDAAADAVQRRYRDRLTVASRRVIAELRPVGGTLNADPAGDQASIDLLRNTVGRHYPRAWLAWHDKTGENLRVFGTTARGSYKRASAADDTPVAENNFNFIVLPMAEGEIIAPVLDLLPENANQGEVDGMGRERSLLVAYNSPAEELYHFATHPEMNDAELKADGWTYGPSIHGIHDPRVPNQTDLTEAVRIITEPRWHRPKRTVANTRDLMQLYTVESAASLYEDQESNPAAVAYHEFGHRVQHVIPNNLMARMERSFLMRRTGKTGLERADQYGGMKKLMAGEFAHGNTGMVADYMAREYYTNNEYEVFTTGVEAVFGGGYGSLLGLSNRYTRQDDEHRAFTLGTLAAL